jgi:hypothetical protein
MKLRVLHLMAVIPIVLCMCSCGTQGGNSDSGGANGQTPSQFFANIEGWTGQVRGMTVRRSNVPLRGTLLEQEVRRAHKAQASCGDYAETLLEILTGNNVEARLRILSLDDTATHVVVEYHDPFADRWNVADPTFGVVYLNQTTQIGQSVEDISALVNAMNFDALDIVYVSPEKDFWLRDYFMDPLTCFLNPVPVGQGALDVVNNPMPYLQQHSLDDIENIPNFYLFGFQSSGQQATLNLINSGTLEPVTLTSAPQSPWLIGAYTRVFTYEWSYGQIPPALTVYTFPVFWTHIASMIKPSDGQTEIDPTAPVQFQWMEIAGADAYRLQVGTSEGADDAFDSGPIQTTVYGGPLKTETTYYARLSTEYKGSWQYLDTSFYTGTGIGRLVTPANGATGVDATKPVQFAWKGVAGADAYYVYVGTSIGADDVYEWSGINANSFSLKLSPGMQYYVRVWTHKQLGYFSSDTSFQTAP